MPAPAMTLAQAITTTRGYLDDRQLDDAGDGRRWSRDDVIGALQRNLSGCVEDYAQNGGDRFMQEVEVETDSTGEVSLLTYDPLAFHAMLVVVDSNVTFPVRAADPALRGPRDQTARDLIVRLTGRPRMPTVDDDALVGVDGGEVRAWPAFEAWVCMCAALELGVTDNDDRATLEAAEARQQRKVKDTRPMPLNKPFPPKRSHAVMALEYVWFPANGKIRLHLSPSWRW